jgi:hypothetical protein
LDRADEELIDNTVRNGLQDWTSAILQQKERVVRTVILLLQIRPHPPLARYHLKEKYEDGKIKRERL